jgi:hypothetical protein
MYIYRLVRFNICSTAHRIGGLVTILSAAGEPNDPGFEKRCERFFAEFEWYALALRAARAEGLPY